MTRKEMIGDLREIRYYYSRKKSMKQAEEEFLSNEIVLKIRMYNEIISKAPIRMYDLYVELFTRNNSQEGLAEKWGYSPQTIRWWVGKLYDYIFEHIPN